ncbi:MAG: membrane protein insertion efficiency factor YidD [Rhodospirillales bacterium]|nr:MAG: membrane protein insertion efficiency factor YidD [Rhodospirillales bacterium]
MNPGQALARGVIYGYRYLLSPVLPAVCRFQPTCSAYALEAIDRFGAIRGSWLALRRLGRCHPWGGSGHDPVPAADRLPGRRDDEATVQ